MTSVPTQDPIQAKLYNKIFSPRNERKQQVAAKQKQDRFIHILRNYNMSDQLQKIQAKVDGRYVLTDKLMSESATQGDQLAAEPMNVQDLNDDSHLPLSLSNGD